MLERVLMLILISAMLTGCLPKSLVLEGNRFQSSSPSLNVKVAARIPYLGTAESSRFDYGTDQAFNRTALTQYDTYYFVETGQNNKAQRFFIIHVSRIVEDHWYYIDTFHQQWKNPLALGNEEIGGRTYNTASLIGSLKGSDFAKYLNSKSCFLADCYAMKVLSRIYSRRNILTLWYGEDCEQFGQHFDKIDMGDKQKRQAMITWIDKSLAQAVVFEE